MNVTYGVGDKISFPELGEAIEIKEIRVSERRTIVEYDKYQYSGDMHGIPPVYTYEKDAEWLNEKIEREESEKLPA